MRPQLLQMAHRIACPDEDFAKFAVRLGEWELTPCMVGNDVGGVLLEKDGEVHVVIRPEYKCAMYWRKNIRELMQPLLDRCGYVTTRVSNDNIQAHNFVQKMGFKIAAECNGVTLYMLRNLVNRRQSCQQQ